MKKINHLNIFFGFCLSLLLFSACGDADVNNPTGSTEAPGQVSNVVVKNINGGAIIYYDRPDDVNFKYLRATFFTDEGKENEVNASFYNDSILVSGYKNAGEADVKLYSVSYGEAASAPLIVRISPLTPPYLAAVDSLEIYPTFAGLRVSTKNATGSDLAVGIVKKDINGAWVQIDMEYSKANNIDFAVRGQEPVHGEFGVFFRDRWGHVSPIVSDTLTPWYEVECDKKIMKNYTQPLSGDPFPSDTYICHQWKSSAAPNDNKIERLWDNMKNTSTQPCFHTKFDAPMPQHFTVDLGKTYQLSRVVIHWRAIPSFTGYFFDSGHVKNFELWGSNDPTIGDNFDAPWFKIGDYESTRPSKSTRVSSIDPLTEDEKALITYGQEFSIPLDTPPVRYYRFKTLSTWGSTNAVMINEITFFGTEKN